MPEGMSNPHRGAENARRCVRFAEAMAQTWKCTLVILNQANLWQLMVDLHSGRPDLAQGCMVHEKLILTYNDKIDVVCENEKTARGLVEWCAARSLLVRCENPVPIGHASMSSLQERQSCSPYLNPRDFAAGRWLYEKAMETQQQQKQ